MEDAILAAGGEIVGSGTGGAKPEGPGATLTVNGKDDHGHDVELTIQCYRLDQVVAEGG